MHTGAMCFTSRLQGVACKTPSECQAFARYSSQLSRSFTICTPWNQLLPLTVSSNTDPRSLRYARTLAGRGIDTRCEAALVFLVSGLM